MEIQAEAPLPIAKPYMVAKSPGKA